MAKELIRVPRVLGESYNSVLIERLYEAGGNVMLDLIIYLGSYHLKDLFGTSWFSVEDFCRKMGYDRTNLQRKLDSRAARGHVRKEYAAGICMYRHGRTENQPSYRDGF